MRSLLRITVNDSLPLVSAAYNFTLPGEGNYTVEASNLFHYVDPETNEPVEIRANSDTHVAAVSGRLAVARHTPALGKRATFNGCSSSQQSAINAATPAAQTYAANALS